MKSMITLLTILLLASCKQDAPTTVPDATPAIDEAKTKEVFDHHVKAFMENDMEAVMADYTEESILITPDVTYNGLAEIRLNFESAFKLFPKDSTTFNISKTVIKKDLAYFIWSAKSPALELGFATDTFVIQNGKIIRQSFAGH